MSEYKEIRTLLFALLKQNLPVQTLEARVESVDKQNRVCHLKPTDGSPDLFDARITAVVDNQSSYVAMFPEPGSIVLATVINNDPKDVHIMAVSEIESLELKVGESTVKISDQGHVFNSGSLGGMVITPELKTQLDKTNAVVQSIIDIVNGAPIIELGNGAPSNLQSSMKFALQGKQLGDFTDIENEKVKH